ncbi:putative mediator of RNA polymerase II transcription subunit 26 [Microplitis demolitor]|uniref:putative mediator of RNA polymerase II transcription subunit 26 n=1 Tax=Microplitis demolitor TaxID=69319 RepID=UPI00235B6E0B|nr:putative mediator of RNA polymerase II transcription subunit 26 [Microplitis demolitor]
MGRVCAVKNCNSGSAADKKRRSELNLKSPGFFKVPQCPLKRQQRIDSLTTELNDRQYVCDLHFQNDAIQNSYLTNLPNGEVNKIVKGRITRMPGSVPLIVNVKQSSIIGDCKIQALNESSKMRQLIHEQHEQNLQFQAIGEHQGQLLYEISEKPKSLHEKHKQNQEQHVIEEDRDKSLNKTSEKLESLHEQDHHQQQQQQVIEEHQDQFSNETFEKPKSVIEQDQQQQVIEEQFNFDDMRTENQEQSYHKNQENEQINNILPQYRLPVKRKLKYPDENETLKRQKYSEHDIDINRQINFDNDTEIMAIIIELNKLFPIGWSFLPGINQLIAIQFDRIKFKERVRLVLNDDHFVSVTFLENYKKKIDRQIKSVNDLIECLKSMEQKKLCTGTGYDKKSYSLKCYADVTDKYKRCQACPRCQECQKLRLNLQKVEKSRILNTENKIKRKTSKATNLGLYKKTKRIQQQLQLSTLKLRSIQKNKNCV